MRRVLTGLALAALAAPVIAIDHREIRTTYQTTGLESLHFDLPVAEVRFEGYDGGKVEVDLFLECRRASGHECEHILDALRLEERRHGRTLDLELEGYPRWSKGKIEVEALVRVPRALDLDLEMGVGEVDVEGLAGDLRLDIGVGEVNIWLDQKTVRSVSLDAGVGETELHGVDRQETRRSLFVGSKVSWFEGDGEARILVDVGVGEISVWVD